MSKMTAARLSGGALKWLLIVMASVAAAGFAFTRDFEYGVETHEMVEAVGRVMIVTWILGRVWCSLYGSGAASNEMAARGPYSIVRNPLHLFTVMRPMVEFHVLVNQRAPSAPAVISFGWSTQDPR